MKIPDEFKELVQKLVDLDSEGVIADNEYNEIIQRLREKYEVNTCDNCYDELMGEDLIWIDAEDFTPKEEDNFSQEKCESTINKMGCSALCIDCYKDLCCDKEKTKNGKKNKD